jgi:hypothetical protein
MRRYAEDSLEGVCVMVALHCGGRVCAGNPDLADFSICLAGILSGDAADRQCPGFVERD